MRPSVRAGLGILAGTVTVLAVAGLLVLLLPTRGMVPLPRTGPPRPGQGRMVRGLLAVRRRLSGWLPERGLRSWVSPYFRAFFLKLSGYRRAAAALVSDMVQPEDTVLDIGTGEGWIALEAARIARRVEATDSSPAAVEQAKRLAESRGRTRAAFRQAPATALPFPDGSFSLVLSGLLMLAIPRSVRQQALEEAWRVLQPGGRLAFFIGPAELGAIPTPDSQWQRYVERAGFVEVQLDHPQTMFPVLKARKPMSEPDTSA